MNIKKRIMIVALAVCIISVLSLGSLAWFSYTDEVSNTFKVADSDTDGSPDFSIDVKESKTDAEGNKGDLDNDGVYDLTDDGNVYENIAPNEIILKDPAVTNTGDYSQYVRVNLVISKNFADQVAEEQGVAAAGIDMEVLFPGFDNDLWAENEFDESTYADYYIYAYYYDGVLGKGETINVFNQVHIPEGFEVGDMNFGTDGFKVNVKADAIQSDNIQGPAKAAFDSVNWTIGTVFQD